MEKNNILYHYVLRCNGDTFNYIVNQVEYNISNSGKFILIKNPGKRYIDPANDLDVLVDKSSYSMYSLKDNMDDHFFNLIFKHKEEIISNLRSNMLRQIDLLEKLNKFRKE